MKTWILLNKRGQLLATINSEMVPSRPAGGLEWLLKELTPVQAYEEWLEEQRVLKSERIIKQVLKDVSNITIEE